MNGFAFGSLYLGHPALEAVLALVAGILILLVPRILHYVVAVYLIVVGALELLKALNLHHIPIPAVAALAAGILVLVRPRLLHVVVGIYLVLIGLVGVLRW